MHVLVICYAIFTFLIVSLALILACNLHVFALSKPFKFREVEDDKGLWLGLSDGIPKKNGMHATDIESVIYYSDGKVLNATYWIKNLTELTTPRVMSSVATIVYGMLIDSDLDSNTGLEGIDHMLEVSWSNSTKSWTERISELSKTGLTNTIYTHNNYSDFYTKNGHAVHLSLNLSKISSPDRYRVFFYAYNSNKDQDSPWTVDPATWVYLPPPVYQLVSDDRTINISQHAQTRLVVNVLSNTGFKPKVDLSQVKIPGVKTEFEPTVIDMSQGNASIMTVTTNSPTEGVTTLPVKATVIFPTENLSALTLEQHNASPYVVKYENIPAIPLNLKLKFSKDPPFWKPVSEAWAGLGGVANFIYTPIAAIAVWFMSFIKYNPNHPWSKAVRRKGKKQSTDDKQGLNQGQTN